MPKNHQSVLDAEDTDRHRTTSVVCSVVLSQVVALVWGMGYACAESVYDSRCSAHAKEYDFLAHQKGVWHENTGVCGNNKIGWMEGYTWHEGYHQLTHQRTAVQQGQVCGVFTLFPPVDAHF